MTGFLTFSGPGLLRNLQVEASYSLELQKSFEAQKSEFPQPYMLRVDYVRDGALRSANSTADNSFAFLSKELMIHLHVSFGSVALA